MPRWLILINTTSKYQRRYQRKSFVPVSSVYARSKREALSAVYLSCPKAELDAIPWEQATEQQRESVKSAA